MKKNDKSKQSRSNLISNKHRVHFLLQTPLVIITVAPQQALCCPVRIRVLSRSSPEPTFCLIGLIRGISQRQRGTRQPEKKERKDGWWTEWEGPCGSARFYLLLFISNSCLRDMSLGLVPFARSSF